MHSIRRSCSSALRKPNDVCLHVNGTRRAFSRSNTCSRGALPVFLPPSTPELSSLLSSFNSRVLLPCHLTKEQEKLVYKLESRAKLEAEPVEITLGDVTLPLTHLDRNKDLPGTWRSLRHIIKKSKTREDWENVIRVMEGMENAGRHVKPAWQELIVRSLNKNDMHHLVLKALQRPKATGLRLNEPSVVRQVLRGVHDKAALGDWEEEETAKALRLAKQIVELMDDEEHQVERPRGKMVQEGDLRGTPLVVAVPTELAAVLAERYDGDVAEVKKMAGRLMNALKQHEFMQAQLDRIAANASKTSADFKNGPRQAAAMMQHCYLLFDLIPVWNALRTLGRVLGADMPMAEEAQKFEKKIEQALEDGVKGLEKLQIRNGKTLVKDEAGGLPGYIVASIKQVRG